MISKVVYINIALALAAGFFLTKTIDVWRHDPLAAIKREMRSPDKPAEAASADQVATENRVPPKSAFRDVTDKNLFSIERSIPRPAEASETAEPVPVLEAPRIEGRQITLFGVILSPEHASALISNPEAKAGERQTRWVKAGDQLGQLKVDQIAADSILLADGGKQYRIVLYDRNKSSRGVAAVQTSKPTVVVSQPAVQSIPQAVVKPEANSEKMESAGGGQKTDDGFEIISTPFGTIKRKK